MPTRNAFQSDKIFECLLLCIYSFKKTFHASKKLLSYCISRKGSETKINTENDCSHESHLHILVPGTVLIRGGMVQKPRFNHA